MRKYEQSDPEEPRQISNPSFCITILRGHPETLNTLRHKDPTTGVLHHISIDLSISPRRDLGLAGGVVSI